MHQRWNYHEKTQNRLQHRALWKVERDFEINLINIQLSLKFKHNVNSPHPAMLFDVIDCPNNQQGSLSILETLHSRRAANLESILQLIFLLF